MDPEEKTVYLTFDDGPIPVVTPWVLGVLERYGVKATFFMVGDNVRKHPEVFRQVVERGHRIGNHTFNHIRGFSSMYCAQPMWPCGGRNSGRKSGGKGDSPSYSLRSCIRRSACNVFSR